MKKPLALAALAIVAFGGYKGYSVYQQKAAMLNANSAENIAKLKEAAAQQNEDAIFKPAAATAKTYPPKNENRNLYFGDLHIHTSRSFDAYLSGNRYDMPVAYRFARGEAVKTASGEIAQLHQPLDFAAITDHAESFGTFEGCSTENPSAERQAYCQTFETPSFKSYMKLRKAGEMRPPQRPTELCDGDLDLCLEYSAQTWKTTQEVAQEFYVPGEFTTFSGYEYSPPLDGGGKIHRNVIFKGETVPDRAVSAFDALTVLDLWKALEAECTDDCEFLTIPHNMNKSWGIAYSGKTIDGDAYTRDDWALRERNEPIAEMFQVKGNSECGLGAGATDEECEFEAIVPICEGEQKVGCSGPTGFAREGLKIGMQLKAELGFNPLQFGFIGSTDTHNSFSGDTEEWDYRGTNNVHTSPANKRLGVNSSADSSKYRSRNPGGLAAVWAVENTREAIFEAMENRETYATSGTRIRLRFFGGWQLDEALQTVDNGSDYLSTAYANGVAMGRELPSNTGEHAPEFLIWAQKDAASANLQKVQLVKAWIENGEAKEQVFDVACSDGLQVDPKTGRCPDNGARVNMQTCEYSSDAGSSEIRILWKDPAFDPQQDAFYYTRVLQNPTCRWSSYDAIRLGVEPPEGTPALVQERAWSSPIWYSR
jgi:hypothetical protein